MGRSGLVLVLAGCALLTGCASSSVETTIAPDGSYTRTVELRAPWVEPGADGEKMSIGPDVRLETLFIAPSGQGVTDKRGRQGDENVWTFARKVAPGAALAGDVAFMTDGKKGAAGPRVSNTVTVKELSPGRWEYTETLHWNGPRTGAFPLPEGVAPAGMEEFQAWAKSELPAELATPQKLDTFARQFALSFVDTLFGPPDPLFDQILLSPGAARFRLSRRLAPLAVAALKETFGDDLTDADRKRIARSLIASAQSSVNSASDNAKKSGPPESGDGPFPVFMGFTVTAPGEVVETNGIRDPLSNSVSWGLYSFAPMIHDVTLRVVYQAP